MAKDAFITGILDLKENELKTLLTNQHIDPKPILVCSGGTTTRCAANGHWTLDLRSRYQQIDYDSLTTEVEIGGGVNMANLSKRLSDYNRSFPIGLSNQTGIGYILSGGISPLSRSQGLAIDQILEIKGIWGNGEEFDMCKPNLNSSDTHKNLWRGLLGAAAFIAIITKLKLKTKSIELIKILEIFIDTDQLDYLIKYSESWNNSASLQWIWGNRIKAIIVVRANNKEAVTYLSHIKNIFGDSLISKELTLKGMNNFPSLALDEWDSRTKYYSEVVSLLGPKWDDNTTETIKELSKIVNERPNNFCYIGSQQLGEATALISEDKSSFVHRTSIWKPWITASWPTEDKTYRETSFAWLQKTWKTLEGVCPGVHLAQMHPHLSWHQKEIKSAYKNWLPGLKAIKSIKDPNGMLPPI